MQKLMYNLNFAFQLNILNLLNISMMLNILFDDFESMLLQKLTIFTTVDFAVSQRRELGKGGTMASIPKNHTNTKF